VKVALDTSVLVAGVVQAHLEHERARWWLAPREGPDAPERVAAWHAYAEAWAVLTVLPLEPRVTGEVAAAVLDRVASTVRFVEPGAGTYRDAIARCSGRSLRSGAVYDALHLVTAETESVDVLLTFNIDDFTRLAEPASPRILAPPTPPGMPGVA
jgi:predicted nucleic acid-binding protein